MDNHDPMNPDREDTSHYKDLLEAASKAQGAADANSVLLAAAKVTLLPTEVSKIIGALKVSTGIGIPELKKTLSQFRAAVDQAKVEAEVETDAAVVDCPWRGLRTPPGFTLSNKGVVKLSDDGSPVYICGPLWVAGIPRDPQGGNWGLVLKYQNLDGEIQSLSIPRARLHVVSGELAAELASQGLKVVPGKERDLATYLAGFTEVPRSYAVSKVGWLEERVVYALPDTVFGSNEEIIFQPERHSPSAYTYRCQGTLQEWHVNVAQPCQGNPLLMVALAAAFAGPLMKSLGQDGGGLHLYGPSSHGKTAALQVAASVWGCGADPSEAPSLAYTRKWNTTHNALEGLAAAHNDGLLALDEAGTCQARDFGKVVYDLAGGQGKAAMNADQSLKQSRSWRIFLLSTGEVAARQMIEETTVSRRANAGQMLRLLDVYADDIIIESHGKAAAAFVDDLKRSCASYFGNAGRTYLKGLVGAEPTALQARFSEITRQLTPKDAGQEVARGCKRFALMQLAGELAVEFGALPFAHEEIAEAVEWVCGTWVADNENLSDAARGVEVLKDFIIRNPGRFGPSNNMFGSPRDLAGYKQNDLYLFTPEGLKQACAGHEPKALLKELNRLGYLYKDQAGKLQSRHTVAGRRGRYYAVRASLLGEEDRDTRQELEAACNDGFQSLKQGKRRNLL